MPFKKGEASNPFGSLPIGDDLKNARKLSRIEFERLANKYLFMSWDEIAKLMAKEQKNIPAIEMMILSVMHRMIVDGDPKALNFMLDRTIGQSVRKLHVVTEIDEEPIAPVTLTDADRIAMAELYKKKVLERNKQIGEVIDVSSVSGKGESEVSGEDPE